MATLSILIMSSLVAAIIGGVTIATRRSMKSRRPQFTEFASLPSHSLIIEHCWSPDGDWIVYLTIDQEILVWDIERKSLVSSTRINSYVSNIQWSPDRRHLALIANYRTIELLDPLTGLVSQSLGSTLDLGEVFSIAWDPSGQRIASGAEHNRIRFWDPDSGRTLKAVDTNGINPQNLVWSHDGSMLAASFADGSIGILDAKTGQLKWELSAHVGRVRSLSWSTRGAVLASVGSDGLIRLWDPHRGTQIHTLRPLSGSVIRVIWSKDDRILISGGSEGTIQIWDPRTGYETHRLEGVIGAVWDITLSHDEQLLAVFGKGGASNLILWRTDTWSIVALETIPSVPSLHAEKLGSLLSFNPRKPLLAAPTSFGRGNRSTSAAPTFGLHLWRIDTADLLRRTSSQTTHYTNAKVLLLGDTGVGKSGLALVLCGRPFGSTFSTHSRNVWLMHRQSYPLDANRQEEREVLLWDLAGQPGYRVIHQLHLDETSVALVVFDGRSETDPFGGVQYWVRALRQASALQGATALPLGKILVAARSDRGGIGVSRERINEVAAGMGFGAYFETSARTGHNISALKERILSMIEWDALPKVSSTVLFQSIKGFLLEEAQRGRILSTANDLFQQMYISHTSRFKAMKPYTLRSQFETAIGLLEASNLIKRLSFGHLILMRPEILDFYASALVNAVRDEPDGLGSIKESEVRSCNFFIPDEDRLKDASQERLLVLAMLEDLLRRELVLREETSSGTFLIFPSQSSRVNPDLPDPSGKSAAFEFEGSISNIYATLAVRLSYSDEFAKKGLWRNAITYSSKTGGQCGISLKNLGEGRAELTVFFDKTVPRELRFYFEAYVATHLRRSAVPGSVKRSPIVTCSKCGTAFTSQQVSARKEHGEEWLTCPVCSHRVDFSESDWQRMDVRIAVSVSSMDRAADHKRDLHAAAAVIIGKQESKQFDVFLSYHGEDRSSVEVIARQLLERGIRPWLDVWELPPGQPWQPLIEQQIKNIPSEAVFFGASGHAPWRDLEMQALLRQFVKRGCPVIPVILRDHKGDDPDLPVFLEGMQWVDFRRFRPSAIDLLIWGINSAPVDVTGN